MNENINILVVDDDPDVLFATARIVRSQGYQVFEASTGGQALEILQKNQADLVLLDVVLPDLSGMEVCRQIKADKNLCRTLVMLLSGMKTTSAEQAQGLDAGADGFVARPVSNLELKARVNAMVRILRAEKERDQLILELQSALLKIKRLSGLLPICMHCKKIRDDKGYWNRLESFIQENSEAQFSHSICQECAANLYPDMNLYDDV